MKNFSVKFLLIIVLLFANNIVQAQKIGDILKKASKDIEHGVSDAVAKILTDKIVEATVKKINTKLDSLFQEAYTADTTGTESSASYEEFLSGMDASDEVADSYKFDLSTKMKVIDPKGKESFSTLFYTKSGDYFGIQSDEMFVLLDATNEIMVTYNFEEKNAFAFGKNLMRYSSKLIPNDLIPNYEIQTAAGTKDILGYKCQKYIGETSDGTYQVFIAKNFPVSMKNAYDSIGKVFFDQRWHESYNSIDGISLENIYTEKNGDITHSTVVDIDQSGFTLINADYTFGAQ